ncbi:unnamed protein product, partial [Tenebrio molitor]
MVTLKIRNWNNFQNFVTAHKKNTFTLFNSIIQCYRG